MIVSLKCVDLLFQCYMEVYKKEEKKECQRRCYERMPSRRCQDPFATAVAMPLLSTALLLSPLLW